MKFEEPIFNKNNQEISQIKNDKKIELPINNNLDEFKEEMSILQKKDSEETNEKLKIVRASLSNYNPEDSENNKNEKEKFTIIAAKVKGIIADNPKISQEDATRYATEEAEKGVTHKPIIIEGNPEEVRVRQEESKRIRDEGETIEQPINSERGQELTNALQNVALLFNKMGMQWKLDGALNISLREIAKGKNAYFRMHRDVDVHIIGEIDGEQLSKILQETKFAGSPHGYGAFINDESLNKPDSVQKRGYLATEFKKGETPNQGLRFFRLDEDGNPRFKIGEIVIDVHCSKDKLKSLTEQELPEAWQTTGDKVKINNEMVSLDNIGSVLYHKLITGRERDFIDIDFMVENGQIKTKDINEVRMVVQKDLESQQIHKDQKEVLQKSMEKLNKINKDINLA